MDGGRVILQIISQSNFQLLKIEGEILIFYVYMCTYIHIFGFMYVYMGICMSVCI